MDNSMAIPQEEPASEAKEEIRQAPLKQVKIFTYGPAGKNREKFKRKFPKNPQNQILNEIPHEVTPLNHSNVQNLKVYC